MARLSLAEVRATASDRAGADPLRRPASAPSAGRSRPAEAPPDAAARLPPPAAPAIGPAPRPVATSARDARPADLATTALPPATAPAGRTRRPAPPAAIAPARRRVSGVPGRGRRWRGCEPVPVAATPPARRASGRGTSRHHGGPPSGSAAPRQKHPAFRAAERPAAPGPVTTDKSGTPPADERLGNPCAPSCKGTLDALP